jgi:FkbM family methyltransferase
MTTPSPARRLKRRVFRALLRPVPFGLKVWIAKRLFPNLAAYLPPGHERLVEDYLGEFRAVANSSYPTERGLLIGRYEPVTLTVIDSLVRDGDVCFDIGANVGALTMPMARRVGPQRNLSLNPSIHERVVPVQVGVADSPGAMYWTSGENDNTADGTLGSSGGVRVEVVSIDAFAAAASVPRVDFAKIDVEGMEYEVLLGGRATWLAHHPILYLETEKRFEAVRGFPLLARIEAFLRELGYVLYRVDKDRRLTAVTAPTMGGNTLAMPTGRTTLVDGMQLPDRRA